jgi:DNA polymerase-3 subunit epsilon
MSWFYDAQVLFDLETDSLDPDGGQIIQGAVVLIPKMTEVGVPRRPQVYEYLIAPEREIPQTATDVHGITTDYAREHGLPPAEGIERMTSMLAVLMGGGATLVGMNVPFDLTYLDRSCRQLGLRTLDERLPGGIKPVVDVLVVDKEMSRRKGKRNLGAQCEHYGVKIDGAHDAVADALAAGRVAWALCKHFPKIRDAKAEDLHDWQIDWKAKQSKSFASWLRREAALVAMSDPAESQRKLADADGIRPEWPVIPCPGAEPQPEPEPEPLW